MARIRFWKRLWFWSLLPIVCGLIMTVIYWFALPWWVDSHHESFLQKAVRADIPERNGTVVEIQDPKYVEHWHALVKDESNFALDALRTRFGAPARTLVFIDSEFIPSRLKCVRVSGQGVTSNYNLVYAPEKMELKLGDRVVVRPFKVGKYYRDRRNIPEEVCDPDSCAYYYWLIVKKIER